VRYPLEAKALASIRTVQLQHLLPGNEANVEATKRLIAECWLGQQCALDKYAPLVNMADERTYFSAIKTDLAVFIKQHQEIAKLVRAEDRRSA
jgi:methyl-accepting chemotaxis protein